MERNDTIREVLKMDFLRLIKRGCLSLKKQQKCDAKPESVLESVIPVRAITYVPIRAFGREPGLVDGGSGYEPIES